MQVGSSALARYRLVEKNYDREMDRFQKQPQIKRDMAYFKENASKATSVDALLKDRRLLQVTLSAFQLEDQINSKAILKKLMTEDPDDKKSLAYRMLDPRFRQLALAMKDLNAGKRPFDNPAFVDTVAQGYATNEFEKSEGDQTPGMREALYFKRTVDGVDVTTKLTQITRAESDLTVKVGGIDLALGRRYDSMAAGQNKPAFGEGWSFIGVETNIQTNIPLTGRESQGIYAGMSKGSRVTMNLPNGQRESFTFTPKPEVVNGVTYYRPAYTADGSSGWTLDSTNVQLTKRGDNYYEAATGRPYNPGNPALAGADYLLTNSKVDDSDLSTPKHWYIDSNKGTTTITTAKDRLAVAVTGDSIVAENGDKITFTRDKAGRITQIAAPGNKTVTYGYDAEGRLTTVKNASAATGSNYSYAEGVMTLAEMTGATKKTTAYASPIEKVSQVLANKVLSTVARTALNLPDQFAALEYDQQKARLEKKLHVEDFKDPAKVDKFVQRFLVNNDMKTGASTSSSPALALLSGSGGGGLLSLVV